MKDAAAMREDSRLRALRLLLGRIGPSGANALASRAHLLLLLLLPLLLLPQLLAPLLRPPHPLLLSLVRPLIPVRAHPPSLLLLLLPVAARHLRAPQVLLGALGEEAFVGGLGRVTHGKVPVGVVLIDYTALNWAVQRETACAASCCGDSGGRIRVQVLTAPVPAAAAAAAASTAARAVVETAIPAAPAAAVGEVLALEARLAALAAVDDSVAAEGIRRKAASAAGTGDVPESGAVATALALELLLLLLLALPQLLVLLLRLLLLLATAILLLLLPALVLLCRVQRECHAALEPTLLALALHLPLTLLLLSRLLRAAACVPLSL